jgi:hypothetical protein
METTARASECGAANHDTLVLEFGPPSAEASGDGADTAPRKHSRAFPSLDVDESDPGSSGAATECGFRARNPLGSCYGF